MRRVNKNERARLGVTLNGRKRTGEAEPRMLLSDFIRHVLGATGTHVGCEHGVCGCCTVLLDGTAVRSCLTLAVQAEGRAVTTVTGDMVAVIGTNHKMVVFGLDQVPEMARGRGVRLQKYTSAKLSDVTTFDSKEGLTWKDGAGRDQSRSMKELADWRGNRADAVRLAHGLPKSNKFGKPVE